MPEESAPNLSPVPGSAPAAVPKDDGFASDIAGPPVAGAAAARQEPATPAFDPDKVDWYRAKPDELPPWAQNVQRQIKAHLAEQTRAEQELANARRQPEHVAAPQPEVNAQLARAIEKLAPKEDPYADLRSRMAPEEVGAIDVVDEIISRKLASTTQPVQTVQQQLQQMAQVVAALVQQTQAQQTASQIGDFQAAVAKYGEDGLRGAATTLRGMLSVVNPATNRPFTLVEAADLVLGRSTQARQDAEQKDAQVRESAKRQLAGTPAMQASSGNGPMSNEQVLAELRSLGFK